VKEKDERPNRYLKIKLRDHGSNFSNSKIVHIMFLSENNTTKQQAPGNFMILVSKFNIALVGYLQYDLTLLQFVFVPKVYFSHLYCSFLVLSSGIIYGYYSVILKIDEEEFGGHGALLQEGLFASTTLFLVM